LKRAQTGVPVEPQRALPSLVQLARNSDSLLASPGDCIDCGACVAVCPTGIDIREGPQIGCITCGLCIDACDEMMIKVGRPTKLIGYTTELDARAEQAGQPAQPPLRRLLRPRTIAYLAIWSLVGLGMLFALGARTRLDLSVLQNRNPIWVRLSDGDIRNTYQIKIRNMEARPREVEVSLAGLPGVLWDEHGSRHTAGRFLRLTVGADKVTKLQLFVAALGAGPQRSDVAFSVRALDREGGGDTDHSFFERPEAQR
jgi:cytochrome c oxidase accessory protein FixG